MVNSVRQPQVRLPPGTPPSAKKDENQRESVCPFVGIGFSLTPSPASECVSPLDPEREGVTLGCGEGVADPIRTTRQRAWHSVLYTLWMKLCA